MITTRQPEIWAGSHEQLPADRRELVPELFAEPSVRFENDVALVTVIGLLDHAHSLRLMATINDLVADGARGLVLRVSSRAQVTRGALLPGIALENANIPTVVSIIDFALGAMLAVASGAQSIVIEDAAATVGRSTAAVKYGAPMGGPSAEDISLVLDLLSQRRIDFAGESFGQSAGRLVNSGRISEARCEAVLAHLTDLGD